MAVLSGFPSQPGGQNSCEEVVEVVVDAEVVTDPDPFYAVVQWYTSILGCSSEFLPENGSDTSAQPVVMINPDQTAGTYWPVLMSEAIHTAYCESLP